MSGFELKTSKPMNNLPMRLRFEETMPDVLNKYIIDWFLAAGGFGSVVLAKKKPIGVRERRKQYAIKLIGPIGDRSVIENELHYMKMLKNVSNVVKYVEHFDNGPFTGIVMKYFRADSFVKSYRTFTPRQVQYYMQQLLEVLMNVHSFGIIHGDIKPENFLFNITRNKFLLIDFGMTKPVGQPLDEHGTVGYIAPESILRHTKSTDRIDIWSAGIIFMCLLSGLYPFCQGAGPNALREFCILFGSRDIKKVAKSLGQKDIHDVYLENFEYRNPLNLQKICLLFRRYQFYHADATLNLKCPLCDQMVQVCLCDDKTSFLNVTDPFSRRTYSLLKKMLALNPLERISAEDALAHDFFHEELSDDEAHCESEARIFKHGLLYAMSDKFHIFPRRSGH